MPSRFSSSFFKVGINYKQTRSFIREFQEVSVICQTIAEEKIPEAKKLIAKFAKENGGTYFNMLDKVIDTVKECNHMVLATEVEEMKCALSEEAALKEKSTRPNGF